MVRFTWAAEWMGHPVPPCGAVLGGALPGLHAGPRSWPHWRRVLPA